MINVCFGCVQQEALAKVCFDNFFERRVCTPPQITMNNFKVTLAEKMWKQLIFSYTSKSVYMLAFQEYFICVI